MRGKRLINTYKQKLKKDLLEFDLKVTQDVYKSEKIQTDKGIVMINKHLPDNYWNYIVADVNKGIKELEDILASNGSTASIYNIYSGKVDSVENEIIQMGYNIDFKEAWMLLRKPIKHQQKNITIEETKDYNTYAQIYESGRRATSEDFLYKFCEYDLYIIKSILGYSGELEVKSYIAYYEGVAAGVASTISDGNMAVICDVTTLENYRNKGVGKSLVSGCIEGLSGVDTIYLATEDNSYNESWYNRQGFRKVLRGCSYIKSDYIERMVNDES